MSESYVSEGSRHTHSQSQSQSQTRPTGHDRNANGTQAITATTASTATTNGDDTEAQVRGHDLAQDAGSDDDSDGDMDEDGDDRGSFDSMDSIEEQWLALDEEVTILVADVHDLALYSKLNITGCMKILKVHIRLIRFLFSCHETDVRISSLRNTT